MKKFKDEKGIISTVFIFAMIFLLIFTITIYVMITNKRKIEDDKELEIKQIYSKTLNDVEQTIYADETEVIPIYNIRELNIAGTNEYVQIKNKIYKCNKSNQYLLKENIIIDIKEDFKTVDIGFNDFKFFASGFHIDKNVYDIYYYYDNRYWKPIGYQKFSNKDPEKEFIKETKFLENEFSIIKDYKYTNHPEFMIVWSDKKGAKNNIEIKSQYKIPTDLDQIEVFKKNKEKINMFDGEFYIFVNIGTSI